MPDENLTITDYVALFNSELRTKDQLKTALNSYSKEELVEYIVKSVAEDISDEDFDDGNTDTDFF